MQHLLLPTFLLCLTLHAADSSRTYPSWNGQEPVASYAARVNLPATKTLDLGKGVKLDLVLIPAGEFIMGTAEPEKPEVTIEGAEAWMWVGGIASAITLVLLTVQSVRRRRFAFSLRWALLIMVFSGMFFGGMARRTVAANAWKDYETELRDFQFLPSIEKPAHPVTIARPFYIGKYEVTQEQYQAVMGNNPSQFKGANLPVDTVSWDDAKAFCKKLVEKHQAHAQLPTEAQWEYACRAGSRTRFYSGDLESDLGSVAWYDYNCEGTTHAGGMKKPNAFGLCDMHGNVWEWCEDYSRILDGNSEKLDHVEAQARVLRGGSILNIERNCRSAIRFINKPDFRDYTSGFRVTVSVLDQ